MIRVNYSNRIDRLVDALVDGFGDRSADPLTPATVVVPNPHVATYLKYAIAQRTGIAANIEFPFLDAFLATCVGPNLRALDRQRMHALLCSVLDDETVLAHDDMAPVRAYIACDSEDERALRRFQLARQLADLLTEYALARPDLLASWRKGDSEATGAGVWQRAAYRASLLALSAVRRDSDVQWLPLPELFERAGNALQGVPARVHLFGFSYVARAYYRIFERLSRATDLRVYALNPCRDFWEDVQRRAPDDPDEVIVDSESPPLRWWGAPGRDHVAALTALTEGDFEDWFADPAGDEPSVLAQVQSDVLGRRAPSGEAMTDDGSVRVLACPGVRREAETIASEIWRLVAADSTLAFSDIAVLVSSSDRELYQTHLAAAFRAARDIPHAIADIAASRESRIVDAADQLVSLPYGAFARRDLLRLMTHPAVSGRYADVDVADWLRWADDLAIVHGADRSDHRGTYITGDRFNWDQGIHRLALGAFMAGDRSGDDRWYEVNDSAYLPAECTQDQAGSAAHFAVLARSLIADARHCRSAHKPLAQWSALLGRLMAGYLSAPTEDEERELDQCLRAVESIADWDLDGRDVPYRIAAELARQALAGLRVSRGAMFTSGVVIAPHVPMRPLPFRVVFVAGLGEGRFPAPDRESPLDLRQLERRRGDVSARERDKYLFLETLASARERLYLTYVARDEQTGEALQPASPVQELVHLLETGYGIAAADVVVTHPLRRYAESARDALPEAEREARALALREHLETHLGGARFPSIDELRAQLPAERWAAVAATLGLAPPPIADDERPREAIALSLSALRKFLECPLQASAAFLLGLRRDDDDDDVFELDDEPFATAPLPETMLLRDVFLAALEQSNGRPLGELYDEHARRIELQGKTPTGMFRAVDRDRHLHMLEQWRRNLGVAGDYAVYRFGRARERSEADQLLPPIVLSVDGQRVELFGRTEAVCTALPGSLTLIRRDKPLESHFLRGFMDHVVLTAAGILEPEAYTATVNPASENVERRTYPALTQTDARDYLGSLVRDLIGRVHDYLLPVEIVMDYAKGEKSLDDVVASRMRRQYPGISSMWGPVRHVHRFGAPDEADDIIERRLERYLTGGAA